MKKNDIFYYLTPLLFPEELNANRIGICLTAWDKPS
ncbi:MAG: hypothetical protein RLZZ367_899 [Bacteroidota bacterium]|jgi:hypothetical protein